MNLRLGKRGSSKQRDNHDGYRASSLIFSKNSQKTISLLILSASILIFFFLFLIYSNFTLTGHAVSLSKTTLQPDENLQGSFDINLKEGELIPSDSIVSVAFSGKMTDIPLSEFITISGVNLQERTGDYFSSSAGISGSGTGYGWPGELADYPPVSFKLEPEVFSILEEEQPIAIEGTASKGNDYVYDGLANLVPGSVYVSGKQLGDNALIIRKENGQTIVSTDYHEETYGFGSAFLNNNEHSISLDLEKLNLSSSDEGAKTLLAELSYNGIIILSETQTINVVSQEIDEMPVVDVPIPTIQDAIAPLINFTSPTPESGKRTTNTSVQINASIADLDGLSEFKFNWNSTNYSLYDDSLVLMLNFNNLSSLRENATLAVDMSKYSNNATCHSSNCPVWTPGGKFGGAYNFSNSAVNRFKVTNESSVSLDLPNAMTLSAWIYPKDWIQHRRIITRWWSGNLANSAYSLDVLSNGEACFEINNQSNDYYFILCDTDNVTANQWQHIVGAWNGTVAKIYMNGVEKNSVAFVGTTKIARSYPLFIGSEWFVTSYAYEGSLDEVRIYNRSLSASEIRQLYQSNLQKLNQSQWYFYSNQSNLSETTYTYSASAKDVSGNENQTETRSIAVQSEIDNPLIEFKSPTLANGAKTSSKDAIINVSVSEKNLNELKFNWNNTNYTFYNDSLVFMMNFDNLSSLGENNTFVRDLSRYGNNGTINGTVPRVAGKFGLALNFSNNESHYLATGFNPDTMIGDYRSFTVSAWIWHLSNGSQDMILGSQSGSARFLVGIHGTNMWHGYIGSTGFGGLNFTANDRWAHATYVYSNVSDTISYYLDGVYVSNSSIGGNHDLPSVNITVGKDNTGYDPFNGKIDEVRIWNRILSEEEIKQQYQSNLQKYNQSQWYLYSNQSNLSYATYSYSAYAKDISRNENSTETRSISVQYDPDNPLIEFKNPTPANGARANTSAIINVSISEANMNEFKFNWNSNYSIYDGSLVFMMNFDNLSSLGENNTFVRDISQYGNNGTIVNTIPRIAGKFGLALNFSNNNSNYVAASFNPDTMIGDYRSFTVSAWIWHLSNGSQDMILGSQSGSARFMVGIHGDNNWHFYIGSIGIEGLNFTGNDRWAHVSYVYSNVSDTMSYYLDGIYVSNNSVGGNHDLPSVNITIGKENTGFDPFNGKIDEVRIWNRSLSADEIKQQYYSNLQKFNQTQWYFYSNQSNLSYSITSSYSAYAKDISGNENQTETRILNSMPLIYFVSPTPASGASTSNRSFEINVSLVEPSLAEFKFSWNNTNYTFYDNSLKLMMNFDNLSSLGENATFIVDSSNSSGNGTIMGDVTWISEGKYGGAYRFGGNMFADYIKTGNSAIDFSSSTAFTMSAWFNTRGSFAEGDIGTLISTSGTGGQFVPWFHVWNPSGNTYLVCGFANPGSWGEYLRIYSVNLSRNTWYHGSFVFNGSTTFCYINGILGNQSNLASFTGAPYANVSIGSSQNSYRYNFNGSIDEVRIWNRTLNASEIQQNYYSNLNKYSPTQWYFYSNQSNLSARDYTYSASAKDIFSGENSATRSITIYSSAPVCGQSDTIGLISYWKAEGNALDVMGILNGTVTGSSISYSNGQVERAFYGNALSKSFVNTSHNTRYDLNLSKPVTIAAWIKPSNLNTSFNPVIISKGGMTWNSWNLYLGDETTACGSAGAQDLVMLYYGDSGVAYEVVCANYTASANTWTHVVYTFNGTGKNLSGAKFYINGALANTGFRNLGQNASPLNTKPLQLVGLDRDEAAYRWNGSIDELAIYNRSLSASEIQTLYLRSNSGESYCTASSDITSPFINFTYPTPASGTTTSNTSVQINASIPEGSLGEFKFNWSSVDLPFYDGSLVLMMNFDNNSALGENALKIVDLSKYSNNGTVNGSALWNSSGKFGGAYWFDGVNDFINTSFVPSTRIGNNNPFTIEAWAYPIGTTTMSHVVCAIDGSPNYWRFYLTVNQNAHGLYGFGLGDSYYNEVSNWTISFNQWQHIALRYNGTTIKAYKNGNQVYETTFSGSATLPAQKLAIGAEVLDGSYYAPFNGSIDEVRIYNRSLSDSEIKQIYQSNLKRFNQTQWYFYSNQSNLNSGDYTYSASAKDTVGNSIQTETRTLQILDVTPPSINFTNPTPSNGTITTNTFIPVFIQADDINYKNYSYYLYNSTGLNRKFSLLEKSSFKRGESGIVTGGDHTCVLLNNGNVTCWGKNNYGQANNYTLGDAIQVSTAQDATCVLRQNGNVTCWGLNDQGQANNYTQGNALQVKGGSAFTCVLLNNGNAVCWGANDYGQIKNYTLGNAVSIGLGSQHACVLLNNGNITCWGRDDYGQSNNYTQGNAVQVIAGGGHTCALLNNGNVSCWGDNSDGQSANYTSGNAVFLTAGFHTTCALLNTGNVTCWGLNNWGQANSYNQGNAIEIASKRIHTCALLNTGNVTCWGYNVDGESNNYTKGDGKKQSFYAFQNLNSGTYYLNATACDIFGNCNSTETRTITIYTPFPAINFTSPTPESGKRTTNTSVQINVSISTESSLGEMKFNWNSANYTFYDDSLFLMMNFENKSSLGENKTYFVDLSKYSNNGTGINFNGDEITSSGKFGKAISLVNISDSYIQVPDKVQLHLTRFTASFWVKFNQITDGPQLLGYHPEDSSKGPAWLFQYHALYGGMAFRMWEGDDAWHGTAAENMSAAMSANRWYHVAGTYNGSTGILYIDGSQIGTFTHNLGYGDSICGIIIGGASETTTDGSCLTGTAMLINGTIDEVALWNRTLSSTEIKQQYYSNLQKYNQSQWYFYSNQSNLSAGIYTYSASAKNILGNEMQTETRTLQILDTTPPLINFTSPTPANGTSTTNKFIPVFIQADDANYKNYSYYLYNSTGLVSNDKYPRENRGVAAGSIHHTCALLNNGNITCWGRDDYGQSKNYTHGNAVEVSAGTFHTCALLNNGNITCWGDNTYNQSNNYTQGNAIEVAAGDYHNCALLNNGNITCWGENQSGKINNYNQGNAVGVSAGQSHTCALLNNGNITCWGNNGNNRANNYSYGNAIEVAAGGTFTCALLNNGNVTCWGENNAGQSNNYSGGDAIKIATGYGDTCALLNNGNITCWGDTSNGLSNNYTNGDAIGISIGQIHSCILLNTGNITCFGVDNYGQTANYNKGDAKKHSFYAFQFLDTGTYYLNATSCDVVGNCNSTETRTITIISIQYSNFQNSLTTDFNSLPDLISVQNATIGIPSYGLINYSGKTLNFEGADLDANINISYNYIFLNSSALPNLNTSAILTLYNLSFVQPIVYSTENGIRTRCDDCMILSYNGNLTFNVSHFSAYSAGENSSLNIFDDTDTMARGTNQQVKFYANYSNATSAIAGANCSIKFNLTGAWEGLSNMTFNSTSKFYEYNRTFPAFGAFYFNVECNGTSLGYDILNVTDNFTISDSIAPSLTIFFPVPGPYTSHNQTLNFSASDNIELSACWKRLNNGQNITISCYENNTVNSSEQGTIEGDNTIYLWANDTAGNNASASVYYTIDTIAPAITLFSPSDNEILNDNSVNLTFFALDVQGIDTCELWGNWSGWHKNQTFVNPGNNTMVSTILNISDGNYYWNVLCNDSINNFAWHPDNHTFTIDTALPAMLLISPDDGTNTSLAFQTFRCNATNEALTNITFYLWNSTDSIVNQTTKAVSGTFNQSEFNLTLGYDDSYKWNCLARDNANNPSFAPANFTLNYNASKITASQNLTLADRIYYLQNNVSCNGTCFIIQANNITLDCQNYQINYSLNQIGYGIYVGDSVKYATIKNCFIQNSNASFSLVNSYGIYLSYSNDNSTIINNVIIASGRAMHPIYANFNKRVNITGNNITIIGACYQTYGVVTQSSQEIIIRKNIINTSSTGASMQSIYLSSTSYSSIDSNQVYSVSSSADSVEINGVGNNITNNIINAYADSTRGLRFGSASKSYVANNTINTFASTKGLVMTGSNSNTFISNTINVSGLAEAIYLSASSHNNFINTTAYSSLDKEIKAESGSENNTFINLMMPLANISCNMKDVDIEASSLNSPSNSNNLYNIGKYLNITNNSADSLVLLNISYNPADIPAWMNETSLKIYKYNNSNWVLANTTSGLNGVDTANKVVFANITSFSVFAPLGEPFASKVDLITPSNAARTNIANQTFRCSATNAINLANITFYLWNSTALINQTTKDVSGIFNETEVNLTLGYDDNYKWNCLATDSLIGNPEFSESNYTLIFDGTSPAISFISPTPSNNALLNNGYISVFIEANDANYKNYSYYLYNFTGFLSSNKYYSEELVSAGQDHSCALINNGNVTCWGDNTYGQAKNYSSSNAIGVSAGRFYTCALINNGNITCWGYNNQGQAKNYTQGNAVGVSAGTSHVCALLNTGNVTCWGDNTYGQAKNYTSGDAVGVSAGQTHSCVLLNNGNITCWGDNTNGQANNYTQGNAVGISCSGAGHTCALLNNGNVTCWGYNNQGQANNYTQGNAIGISTSNFWHTCALLNNGNVTCWGYNLNGRANNYTLGDAIGVSAGASHTCALLNTGNVNCWGDNTNGRANNYTLGDAKKQAPYSFLNLKKGAYYLDATSCDSFGNCNTAERTFYLNSIPSQSAPVLNSTSGANWADENITCYPQNLADSDNDAVYPVFSWKKNNQPITLINMPFDLNVSSNATRAIKDYSGLNNNGTLINGPVWTSGKIGGAYYFDGIDDKILIQHNESLSLSPTASAFTISFWANLTNTGYQICDIINKGTTEGNANYLARFEKPSAALDGSYNGSVYFALGGQANNFIEGTLGHNLSNSIGKWTFWTFVNNKSNVLIYKNGEFLFKGNNVGSNPSSDNVSIGRAQYGCEFYLDSLILWNTSLSSHEIYQLYLEGNNSLNTSTIVSNELNIADSWACSVTPTDLINDGTALDSNSITIIPAYPTPTFSCSIEESSTCISGTALLRMKNASGGFTNGHAQVANASAYGANVYNNTLCCSSNYNIVNSSGEVFLRLEDYTNSHVQSNLYSTYNFSAYLKATSPRVPLSTSCSSYEGSCPENYTCLLSMASISGNNQTNAHVANCSHYDTKVCCVVAFDTPPVSILISPDNNYKSNSSNQTFICNATDDSSVANITLYVWNSTDLHYSNISSASGKSSSSSWNLTLSDDNYLWNCLSQDSISQTSWASNRSLLVDTIYPTVQFIFPTTESGNYSQNWTSVNVTANDTNLDAITIYLYNLTAMVQIISSSNYTLFTNFTNLADGTYYLNASSNDTAGNTNFTETRTINLDTTPPVLNILFPAYHFAYASHNLTLNFSASDAFLGIDTCWKRLNNGQNITISCFENNTVNSSSEGTLEGDNVIYLWANDSLGNTANISRLFHVDTINTLIELYSPEEDSISNHSEINFTFSAFDVQGIDTCELWGNWSGGWHLNQTFVNPENGTLVSAFINISDGNYYWNIFCNDTANNPSWHTTNHSFSVDSTFPAIQFINPTISSGNYDSNSIYANVSSSDINLDTITLNLYNLTGLVNSTHSSSQFFYNFTNLTDQIYYLNASANDTAGNTNYTETRIIEINVPPTHTNPVLNSTSSENRTNEPLTCYPQNLYDSANKLSLVFNWKKNNVPISVLNMPFDLNTSSNATNAIRDYSGFNNNGTLGNGTDSKKPAWTAGKIGGAYSFDGLDDYIYISDSPSVSTRDKLTFMAWIKPNSVSGETYLYTKNSGGSTNGQLWVRIYNSHASYFLEGASSVWYDGNTALSTGAWQHIAVTYDSSSGKSRLYVNGVLDKENSTGGSLSASNGYVLIGSREYNQYYNGIIDDLRIYNVSLSESEIQQIYLEGNNSLNTSTIMPSELAKDDTWKCSVTPNDLAKDGLTLESNNLTVTSLCGAVLTSSINLTSDMVCSENGLNIGANGITVDCQNHWINGSGSEKGINLTGKSNNIIKNCRISGFSEGIYAFSSSQYNIFDNFTIINSITGASLSFFSEHNTISNSRISGSPTAINLFYFPEYTDIINCTINGKVSASSMNDLHIHESSINSSTDGAILPRPIITNTNITSSGNYGLFITGSQARVYNLSINGGKYGLLVSGNNPLDHYFEGLNINNTEYGIFINNSYINGLHHSTITSSIIGLTINSRALSNLINNVTINSNNLGALILGNDTLLINSIINGSSGINISGYYNRFSSSSVHGGISLQNSIGANLTEITVDSSAIDFISSGGANNTLTNMTFNSSSYPTKASFTYSGDISVDSSASVTDYGLNNISKYLNVTNQSEASISLNISYLDSDLGSVDESTLRMFRYSGNWNFVSGSNVDTSRNIVYGTTSSFSIFAPMSDSIAPSASLISPANNSLFNSPFQNFVCNATDNSQLANMTFYLWNSTSLINQTATIVSGAFNQTNLSITLPEEGNYSWACEAYDAVGYNHISSNYTLSLDMTYPLIAINSPENKTYNITSILVDLFSIGSDNTWFYNGTGNESYSGPVYRTFNQQSNTLRAYANDSSGNFNQSSVTFFVDSIYPLISIAYPSNITYPSNRTELNYTITEANPRNCWYSLNNGETNTTISPCGNNVTGISSNEGNNTWTVWINDSAGNINQSSVTFIVDTTAPIITIVNPAQSSTLLAGTTSANIQILTNEIAECRYLNISAFNFSDGIIFTNTTALNHSFLLENLTDGTAYALYYKCNDTLGNINPSATLHSFSVAAPSGGGPAPCVPATCSGKECGTYDDGCGGQIYCGSLTDPCTAQFGTCSVSGVRTCSGGVYGSCSATDPTIANCAGKNCGSDGCGGTCGTCTLPETCHDGICAYIPSCSDSIKNQDETDIDCGGVNCSKCANGKDCSINTDCLSNKCDAGKCVAPSTCNDNLKNGLETDIDCGDGCLGCSTGKNCSINTDCLSNNCTNNVCSCIPEWGLCGDWSSCSAGKRTRMCYDMTSCELNGRIETQDCCIDDTPPNTCSPTKPKYCLNGSLVDSCSSNSCGCPENETCNPSSNECEITGCLSDSQCPPGYECLNKTCEVKKCSKNSDCPVTYKCDKGECILEKGGCKSDSDCPVNGYCHYGQCKQLENYKEEKPAAAQIKCTPKWKCSALSECKLEYSVKSLIGFDAGKMLEGKSERTCIDENNCMPPRVESIACKKELQIKVEREIYCDEPYVNIYNLNGTLIASIAERTANAADISLGTEYGLSRPPCIRKEISGELLAPVPTAFTDISKVSMIIALLLLMILTAGEIAILSRRPEEEMMISPAPPKDIEFPRVDAKEKAPKHIWAKAKTSVVREYDSKLDEIERELSAVKKSLYEEKEKEILNEKLRLEKIRAERRRFAVRKEVHAKEADLSRFENELSELKKEVHDTKRALRTAGEEEKIDLSKAREAIWKKFKARPERTVPMSREKLRLEKELEKVRERIKNVDKDFEKRILDVETARNEIRRGFKEKISEKEISVSKREIRLEKELDELKEEIKNISRGSAREKFDIESIREEIREGFRQKTIEKEIPVSKREIRLENELESIKEKIESSRDFGKRRAESIEDIRKEIKSQIEEAEKIKKEIPNQSSKKIARLKDELGTIRRKIFDMKNNLD